MIPVLPSFMSCHTRCLIFLLVTQKNVFISREKEKSGPLNPSFLPFPLCPTEGEGSEKEEGFSDTTTEQGFPAKKSQASQVEGAVNLL